MPDVRCASRLFLIVACLAAAAHAQDSTSAHPPARSYTSHEVFAGALAASLALDEPLRRFAASHQTYALAHASELIDPLGRAQVLVPGLAASVIIPAALGRRSIAARALRIAAGYAAADLSGGALRVIVARHRPDSTGNPWRLRPFRPQDEWGSMPSAHVTHAFAIAAGIAQETDAEWVGPVAYGLASAVAAQRVYRQAHWTSDVFVAATLASTVTRRIIARLERGNALARLVIPTAAQAACAPRRRCVIVMMRIITAARPTPSLLVNWSLSHFGDTGEPVGKLTAS